MKSNTIDGSHNQLAEDMCVTSEGLDDDILVKDEDDDTHNLIRKDDKVRGKMKKQISLILIELYKESTPKGRMLLDEFVDELQRELNIIKIGNRYEKNNDN